MFARKKYIERKPRIAKILELNTKKGSFVMARMVHTAKITSMTSITIKATKEALRRLYVFF
jgi:hypothetical protein